MKKVTINAPAKVNIVLRVKGRRPDGYHDLVSVMMALDLSDQLVVEELDRGVVVTCDKDGVPEGPGNIAYRAAAALLKEAGAARGVRLHIKKRIPMAAGLGGGSSDAAAALKGITALYGLDVPRPRLMEMALSLGADVPFFLSWPFARAEGVGEVLSELPAPDKTHVVLVNPGVLVSTRWVYENLNLGLTNINNNITLPAFEGPESGAGFLSSCLQNDLERVTAGKYPQINEIKERLVALGALGALMSGSGPTVFGIFGREPDARRAAGELSSAGGWIVIATHSISAWPEPVVECKPGLGGA